MCQSVSECVSECECECVCQSVNVSVSECECEFVRKCECERVCVREREGQKRHTDLNAKRGSLGVVGMEGISEADPCLVRPEAYTTRISLREKDINLSIQISYERKYLFRGIQAPLALQ